MFSKKLKQLITFASLLFAGQVMANVCDTPATVQYSADDQQVTIGSQAPLKQVTLQFMHGGEVTITDAAALTGPNVTLRGQGEHAGKRITGVWLDNGCAAKAPQQKMASDFLLEELTDQNSLDAFIAQSQADFSLLKNNDQVQASKVQNTVYEGQKHSGSYHYNNNCYTPPTVNISGIEKVEGTSDGYNTYEFTISLSSPVNNYYYPVYVDYATYDGGYDISTDVAARAGSDYQYKSGQVKFSYGEQYKTVYVQVREDAEVEVDEYFTVKLTRVCNAYIGQRRGVGTIINDDASCPADLMVGLLEDQEVQRELDASVTMNFTIALSEAITTELCVVSVSYAFQDGAPGTGNSPALLGDDYQVSGGTVEFSLNASEQEIPVTILSGDFNDPRSAFTITLTNVNGAEITAGGEDAVGVIKKVEF